MRKVINSLVFLLLLLCAIHPLFAQTYWVPMNPPPVGSKAFTIDTKDSLVFAATDSQLYVTSTDGIYWDRLNGLHGGLRIHQFLTSGPILYVTTDIPDGNPTDAVTLNRSIDNGNTWDSILFGDGYFLKQDRCLVHKGVFDDEGFSYSPDNGLTWEGIYGKGGTASLVLWSPDFIICAIDSHYGKLGTVLSTDSGNTWRTIPPTQGDIDYDGTVFFTCNKDGFSRSTDTCQTWQLLSSDITNASIIIDGNIFYALTTQGVWYSIDRGSHWKPMNDGLPNFNIKSFHIGHRELYLQLTSNQLFRTTFPSAVRPSSTEAVSITISPNPVSQVCQLQYYLSAASSISIELSDALGRIISKPVQNTPVNGGDHTISFSANGFAPGIYYCRLSTGVEQIVAKFIKQ